MTTTIETTRETARRTAFAIIAAGVASGLPVPARINIYRSVDSMEIFLGDDVAERVDQWAEHLGLPAPAMSGEAVDSGKRTFEPYHVETRGLSDLPGWGVRICSYITLSEESR